MCRETRHYKRHASIAALLACKISGLKSANSVFDGPVTNLLPILWILIEILSCAQGGKTLMISSLALSLVDFPRDGVAGVAVKGLIVELQKKERKNCTAKAGCGSLMCHIIQITQSALQVISQHSVISVTMSRLFVS